MPICEENFQLFEFYLYLLYNVPYIIAKINFTHLSLYCPVGICYVECFKIYSHFVKSAAT